jgi:hypothetical protein
MPTVLNKEAMVYDATVTMQTIICCVCAIPFGVPSQYKAHLHETKDSFYCPSGHCQSYSKSTETLFQEKLAKLEEEKQYEIQLLKNQVHSKERLIRSKQKENVALKSKHTKFKNRVANGVCPCCNRSFENLHNHIKTQHPEFKQS